MAHDRKKPAGSSSSNQQPRSRALGPSRMSEEEIRQALEAALLAEDYARVLELLDAMPRWMKKQPEFMVMRASAVQVLGDDLEALRLLREVERKFPRFKAVHLPMALFYMDREWPAHALQAAKRALTDRDLSAEGRAILTPMIEQATAVIQRMAAELELPFETMQHAYILNERAQIAMDENKLLDVDYFSKEAIKIAPNWNPPYNNRSQALFFSGKIKEAIAVAEAVLTRDADHIFALSNLVTYHLSLEQSEQASQYASRLGRLYKRLPPDGIDIELVITALALAEDTATLWKIAQSYLDAPADSLYGRSWLCLSVAAIRSGKWKDALKLAQRIDIEEVPPEGETLLEQLTSVAIQRKPRLEWMPPQYPGVDMFFYPKALDEWEALLQKISDPMSPSQKRQYAGFFEKYPYMVTAMKRLLWEETGHESALHILADMDRPDADAEIIRFALSQTGPQGARLKALSVLVQKERYSVPSIVKIWNEQLEEWRDVELNNQLIGDIEPNARPATMALIEKAAAATNPQETISLLRQAVETEPTSSIALFNLGVTLVQNEKPEEGVALIHRSVEVDPGYTYGHASIALSEAQDGHEQAALDHLAVVTRAKVIARETAVMANLAWFVLAIRKNDLTNARQRFDMAAQILPEHHLLDHYEQILRNAETLGETFGFMINYQRESAQRAHRKLLKTPLAGEMDLLTCLAFHTKDMLVSTARFAGVTSAGKKGELASRLAKALLDPDSLQPVLEGLTADERRALQWVLEAEGVQPWEDFIFNYGDDMDESTFWNYHEPESIPGRLKMSGLLYSGTLNGQTVAFIPADVRPL
ncbi:MAG: hypothetical protein GYA17_00205, partial [Chloroflexi bacterium]|nr:hypothetical protein [Chloroflexota bacterium]